MGEALRHKAVLFCPPDTDVFRWARSQGILSSGRCPGNYTPLLKEVVGIAGDEIEIGSGHVVLNQRQLPMSKVLPLSYPNINRQNKLVPTGFIWVIGKASPESFDSRYFGPIPMAEILGFAEPLLVTR